MESGAARQLFMVYLEGIRQPARFRAVADKAARTGEAADRRQGRAAADGRPHRAAASHATGALARSRARSTTRSSVAPRHHPRRGHRPHGRRRRRLRVLQAAEGQPRRDHHRVGRQRRCGWPTSCPAHGLERARARSASCRPGSMAMLPSYASALNPIDATAQAVIGEVGYAPIDRRDQVRQSQRIDTILPIASVANEGNRAQAGRGAGGHCRGDRAAAAARHLHHGDTGRGRRLRRSRHSGLYVDAELRAGDQGVSPITGDIRRRGSPRACWRRRLRRRCAARSARRSASRGKC